MDTSIQALVMGLVQGLTEFLPISSSGHLVLVPWLFGWKDPFIESLAFSVMLHMGTLLALLALLLARLAAHRPGRPRFHPRPLARAATRTASWPGCSSWAPFRPSSSGPLLIGPVEDARARAGARRPDALRRRRDPVAGRPLGRPGSARWTSLTFPGALGIGVAQALALFPGISRSGISISAGLFLGLTREAAARFSFLLATPVVAGAGLWEGRKLFSHDEAGVEPGRPWSSVGFVAASLSGLLAIRFMLEFLRAPAGHRFVVYRVLLAVAVFVVLLSPHGA